MLLNVLVYQGMCFYGDKTCIKFEKAAKDIKVFKTVSVFPDEKKIYSYFQGSEYVVGKEYTSGIEIAYNDVSNCQYVSKAIHSYGCDTEIEINYNDSLKTQSLNDHQGIITICTRDKGRYKGTTNYYEYSYRRIGILLCIIPKGSYYSKNSHGEYISDRLQVLDIIEPETGITTAKNLESFFKI